jgi:hypothetical protein
MSVHLPGRVTGDGDGGIDGDGPYLRVGYPAGLLPVVGQVPTPAPSGRRRR